jgi:hypothetical protein
MYGVQVDTIEANCCDDVGSEPFPAGGQKPDVNAMALIPARMFLRSLRNVIPIYNTSETILMSDDI